MEDLNKIYSLEELQKLLESVQSEEEKQSLSLRIEELTQLLEKEQKAFERCKEKPTARNIERFKEKYSDIEEFKAHVEELESLLQPEEPNDASNEGSNLDTPDDPNPDTPDALKSEDSSEETSHNVSPLDVIKKRAQKTTKSPLQLAISLRKGKKLGSNISPLTAIELRKFKR